MVDRRAKAGDEMGRQIRKGVKCKARWRDVGMMEAEEAERGGRSDIK